MTHRNLSMIVFVAALAAAPSAALAHQGPGGNLGVGLGVGTPTGLSLEMSASRASAFELAVGMDTFDGPGGYAHLVYKVSPLSLTSGPTVIVPLYVGAGAFALDQGGRFEGDLDLGVRVPGGVSFDFQRAPLQAFVEVAFMTTVVQTGPERDFWSALGIYGGARFWF
jgi:hypothetical protein